MDKYAGLYELAPLTLQNLRVRRYQGDDLCLPLSAFTEADRERIRALYDILQRLMPLLLEEAQCVPRVTEFLRQHRAEEIVNIAVNFGPESYAAKPSPLMAKTIHDVRGGGLTPLLGQLQFAQMFGLETAAIHALYFLTRDHLKIMRNALLGLDDAKRNEDLLPKLHGTDLIVQKWQGANLNGNGRAIRLEVECPQPAEISECCVEFGALDRILYNLINNACRHTEGDRIRLVLLPIPDSEGENLRFVLINTVSAADLSNLRSQSLEALFEEGTSTTGSGYGLAIASDFVSHAYGLQTQARAIEGGYLGAAIIEDSFAAWFHWPRVLKD